LHSECIGQVTLQYVSSNNVALQRGSAMLRVLLQACFCQLVFSLKTAAHVPETCAPLENHGSYSAVKIGIGTPRQYFDLIADTGSSAVIVTHCACQKTNCFGYSTPCFVGNNRSSTFNVSLDRSGNPESLVLEFGSGVIFGVLGTDVVAVGNTAAMMNRSLVLMYDNKLDASITNFEGIFGLGLPYKSRSAGEQSWLTTASIKRFSMCFTGFEKDGVLRFNSKTSKPEDSMKSVGKYHWGLNFNGISLGNMKAEIIFCDGKTTSSRCGIIPDSGTTLMLGPARHILELYSSICDQWPRCARAYAKSNQTEDDSSSLGSAIGDWINEAMHKWGIPDTITSRFAPDHETQVKLEKRRHFESLLKRCSTWGPDGGDALDKELPAIYWHLSGAEGTSKTLEMPPSSYVVAMGFQGQVACLPFFGEYEYVTAQNGPVWILGSAIFYDYVVQYDLSTSSVAFSSSPCGSCASGSETNSSDTMVRLVRRSNQLRRQEQRVRMPHLDKTWPL